MFKVDGGSERNCIECESGLSAEVVTSCLTQLRRDFDVDIELLTLLRQNRYMTSEEEEPFVQMTHGQLVSRSSSRSFWSWVERRDVVVLECILDYLEENRKEVYCTLIESLRKALAEARLEAKSRCSNCGNVQNGEYPFKGSTKVEENEQLLSYEEKALTKPDPLIETPVDTSLTEVKQAISLSTSQDSVDGHNFPGNKDLLSQVRSKYPNNKRMSDEINSDDLTRNTCKFLRDDPQGQETPGNMAHPGNQDERQAGASNTSFNLDLNRRVFLKDLKFGYPVAGTMLVRVLSVEDYWPSKLGFDFFVEDSTKQRRCICFRKDHLEIFKNLKGKNVYLNRVPEVVTPMNRDDPDELKFSVDDIPTEISVLSAGDCPSDQKRIQEVCGNIACVSLLKEFNCCTRCKRGELEEDHTRSAPYRCPSCKTQSREKGLGFKVRVRIKPDCGGELIELGLVTGHILEVLNVSLDTFVEWDETNKYEALYNIGTMRVTYYTKTMTARAITRI